MRWWILSVIILVVLTGCTREIIREQTIIKDSTPALEEKVADLKDRIKELEARLADYEINAKERQREFIVVSELPNGELQIQQQNITTMQEIPPAPLTTNFSASATISPQTIISEQNASAQVKARINELLERAGSRVSSYSFLYAYATSKLSGSTFYIKGDKSKIKLKSASIYNFENYFDTVYLDMANRTAYGYCEDSKLEACRKGKNYYNLSFEDYLIKTPLDWLEVLKSARDEIAFKAEVILFERDAMLLQLGDIVYWVDEFSGLPIRVQIKKSSYDEIHDYRHLSLNYLSINDVVKR